MSTVVKLADGHYRIFTKGASEIVLAMCDCIMISPEERGEVCEVSVLAVCCPV